jgi:3-methyladenine DNA glycosylase AlkD
VDERLVAELGRRLDARADDRTRAWWGRYLKGAIEFHGVPMAGVREIVHGLWRDEGLDARTREEQLDAVLALFAQPYAEDKLAGILVLAELLLDTLGAEDVPFLARPFERGHVADWSTCDWYCVKVLARLVERDREAAELIAEWRRAPGLWQRRAAAVSLVRVARRGELADLVLEVCAANVRHTERFSQTSVGWVLRELSHADPARVRGFVDEHRELISAEARRMATAKIEGRGRR